MVEKDNQIISENKKIMWEPMKRPQLWHYDTRGVNDVLIIPLSIFRFWVAGLHFDTEPQRGGQLPCIIYRHIHIIRACTITISNIIEIPEDINLRGSCPDVLWTYFKCMTVLSMNTFTLRFSISRHGILNIWKGRSTVCDLVSEVLQYAL